PRLLQDADMLLHAGEGHVELLGKVRDRSVCTPELLQNAASGGVRERGERGIESGPGILNHTVQYLPYKLAARKGSRSGMTRYTGRRHHTTQARQGAREGFRFTAVSYLK